MNQAVQTYRNTTEKEPSPYHLHAVEEASQEMDSRTIGQSIKRVFPIFVVGDKDANVNIVAMRNGQGGPLSRALKDPDKDAIRLVIENLEKRRSDVDWTPCL